MGRGFGEGMRAASQSACIWAVLALTAARSPSSGYVSRKPVPPPPLLVVAAQVGLKASSVRASVSTVQSCGSLKSVSNVIVTLSSW